MTRMVREELKEGRHDRYLTVAHRRPLAYLARAFEACLAALLGLPMRGIVHLLGGDRVRMELAVLLCHVGLLLVWLDCLQLLQKQVHLR
uniref:Uncharacterized protein n=1 Tax=Strombidium inclinatum TaxID=197538 RepID=A0A7S3ILI5_9SPIT